MKKIIVFILLIHSIFTYPEPFRTRVFNDEIKTLQSVVVNKQFSLPIIGLNSSDVINFSFDELSHNPHSYSYKVFQCNSDWSLSELSSTEYLNGYTVGNITDYNTSVNTTVLYTHYSFFLPNDGMSFSKSGNYVVMIYEESNFDRPVAQACFSIVDPKVTISAKVRGNTDTELDGHLQQLDFNVDLNGFNVRDPQNEIKVVVRQNNRRDNEVTNISPSYYSGSILSYINNRSLIFNGGNEYHRFDISSVYVGGVGVDNIRFERPDYHAYLIPDKVQDGSPYINEPDVNGKYVINLQRSDNPDTEADYMWVHFRLQDKYPFFDGMLFLGGEFNYNMMDNAVRMKYDPESESYVKDVLLKQGGYNYQYWFVPKGGTSASPERVDGSHWQTGNEYTIYVYYRGWGERYDRLIGVEDFDSNNSTY